MQGHWYLRADQDRAELLHWFEKSDSFEPLVEIKNPLGRTRTREMRNDKPGVNRSRFAGAGGIHTMSGEKDPHTGAAHDFARSIATFVFEQQKNYGFKRLFVAAEPKFLGQLREKLGHLEPQIQFVWVPRELTKMQIGDLQQYLEQTTTNLASTT